MGKRFDGKVVFITGASSGIGAALAQAFAAEGAKVALLARRKEKLENARQAIEAGGGQVAIYAGDVTDPEDLRRAVADTAAQWGGIDVAVANAGFGVSGALERLTVDDYRRQFEVNFFGALHTIYAVLPYLKATQGRLGLLGSVAGRVGTPMTSPYNASKFAINGLAESVYHELDDCGVSLTCINPGFVESEIRSVNNQGEYTGRPDPVPGKYVMSADKAARQMVDALYHRKPELIVTLSGKMLVWLNRFFPGLFRRIIRRQTRGKLGEFEKFRRNTQ